MQGALIFVISGCRGVTQYFEFSGRRFRKELGHFSLRSYVNLSNIQRYSVNKGTCRTTEDTAIENMKKANKVEFRDAAVTTSGPKTANVRHDHDNAPRKNMPSKIHRGLSSKYGQQNDLREQNRNLEAANEDLQKRVTEMKENIAALETKYTDLQEEKSKTDKHLRDCHMLLVAENIDPVIGERVGKTAQQRDMQRKEVMSVSQNLLTELELFGEMATEHKAQLAEVQNTMNGLKEAREKLQQERNLFSVDVEEMEKALAEAEKLLLE